MINSKKIYLKIIAILDKYKANYKLFEHEPALTYEDLLRVQKKTGFIGTEGKCMVLKINSHFIVYITISKNRVDLEAIKTFLNTDKVRLATPKELKEFFGAEPGCAYPFGFNNKIDIYVDPEIYEQKWFLFSPALPSKTIQIAGKDLKRIFNSLENNVQEMSFNITK